MAKANKNQSGNSLVIGQPKAINREELMSMQSRESKYQPVVIAMNNLKRGQMIYVDVPLGCADAREFQNRFGAARRKLSGIVIPKGCVFRTTPTKDGARLAIQCVEEKGEAPPTVEKKGKQFLGS